MNETQAAVTSEQPFVLLACFASEREGGGDVVPESIAHVSALAVRLIRFSERLTGCVETPLDLFEIEDQFLAALVDDEMSVAGGVAEACVHEIDAVAHGRICSGSFDGYDGCADMPLEEGTDDVPIGCGAAGSPLVAAGIAVDFDFEWPVLG